jgi:hypothetical protein
MLVFITGLLGLESNALIDIGFEEVMQRMLNTR